MRYREFRGALIEISNLENYAHAITTFSPYALQKITINYLNLCDINVINDFVKPDEFSAVVI